MSDRISLILGGARSGKSALAATLAAASGKQVIYIATAQPGDAEMAERIRRHQQDRPVSWTLVEESRDLAACIRRHSALDQCLLIDCLTLWLSNLLHDDKTGLPLSEAQLAGQFAALDTALADSPSEIILVSNEVGLGIVPLGELSRVFVDEAGRLNQLMAARAHHVAFVAAGLPWWLKGGQSHD